MEQRVWEYPQKNRSYVIGGDVAEGLERGDDSVLTGICMETGEQVFEVQGKIDPITLGEMAYEYGMWYNRALVGMENNKDGGANRVLARLNYANIYLQQNNTGRVWDQATDRLGFNMSRKTRLEIIANAREMMQDGSVTVRSQHLLSQFEIFAMSPSGKFEAISGGHDDLVMAWLIAVELFRHQLEINALKDRVLLPYIDGKPWDPGLEDEVEEVSTVDRLVGQAQEKIELERQPIYPSTVGNLL